MAFERFRKKTETKKEVNMPDEDRENQENGAGSQNGDGDVLELSMEEFERRVDERSKARAQELLAAHKEETERDRLELAKARQDIHTGHVKEIVRALSEKGHTPAVLQKAAELMLADTSREEVLTLSIKEKEDSDEVTEKKMSVTDIVLDLLGEIPEASLAKGQKGIPKGGEPPADKDDRPVNEKAEELLQELRDQAVRLPL